MSTTGDLRILTTANGTHRLTVLREATGQRLLPVSTLPNAGAACADRQAGRIGVRGSLRG